MAVEERRISGSSPWLENRETVRTWLECFTRRSDERVEHWIEVNEAGRIDDGRDALPAHTLDARRQRAHR